MKRIEVSEAAFDTIKRLSEELTAENARLRVALQLVPMLLGNLGGMLAGSRELVNIVVEQAKYALQPRVSTDAPIDPACEN